MDLAVRSFGPWSPENFSWLGSAHGTDSTDTITLVKSLFASKSYYVNNQLIPGGVALGKITADGATKDMYGPYDNAASDGRQVMVGHLFGTKPITGSGLYLGAALLVHGKVRLSKLTAITADHGVDANGQADVAGRISYIA
jgi:hypothetical protein